VAAGLGSKMSAADHTAQVQAVGALHAVQGAHTDWDLAKPAAQAAAAGRTVLEPATEEAHMVLEPEPELSEAGRMARVVAVAPVYSLDSTEEHTDLDAARGQQGPSHQAAASRAHMHEVVQHRGEVLAEAYPLHTAQVLTAKQTPTKATCAVSRLRAGEVARAADSKQGRVSQTAGCVPAVVVAVVVDSARWMVVEEELG